MLFSDVIFENINYLSGSIDLGIDEAGRGPVLGPMVYSCFYHNENSSKTLRDWGIDDSKQLKESTRMAIFERLHENKDSYGWFTVPISADSISRQMLRRNKTSLNEIAFRCVEDILSAILSKGMTIGTVFVDTIGKPEAYKRRLSLKFPKVNFVVEEKADSKFISVGAASILAKVSRDLEVAHFAENWFKQSGSPKSLEALNKPLQDESELAENEEDSAPDAKRIKMSNTETNEEEKDNFYDEDVFYDGNDDDDDGDYMAVLRAKQAEFKSTQMENEKQKEVLCKSNSQKKNTTDDLSLGSGYAGDAKTRYWLESTMNRIFGWAERSFVRFSWATCYNMLDEKGYFVNWYVANVENNQGENDGRRKSLNGTNSNATKSNLDHIFNSNAASAKGSSKLAQKRRATLMTAW